MDAPALAPQTAPLIRVPVAVSPSKVPTPDPKTFSSGARLRTYILAGVLVTAPIAVTLWLTVTFIYFIDDQVRWALNLEESSGVAFWVPGLGLVIMLLFLALVGFFAASFLGKTVVHLSEYLMGKMPFVRTIYGALKQILETVLANQSDAFREVCLVEYPRRGMWVLGFVTTSAKGPVADATPYDLHYVFVPTTPNPTSGFLVLLPREEIITLDLSVDDGAKLIISGGIVAPGSDAKAAREQMEKAARRAGPAPAPAADLPQPNP